MQMNKNKTRKNKNNKYNNIQKYISNLYSKNLNNFIIDDIENEIKLNEEIDNYRINNIQNNIQNNKKLVRIKADKYIFTKTEEEDITNYTYYFISRNSIEPCVVIFVPKDKSFVADITKLSYNKECSYSEYELEKKNGTIIMLKTALSYVTDKHPHIKTFKLTDMTHTKDTIDGNKIWITPRRLLLGNKGWYEEYFEAIPTNETNIIKKIIKDNRILLDNMLPKNEYSWWTNKNILNTTAIIDANTLTKNILRTTWLIYKNTIKKFYIPYNLLDENTEIQNNNFNNNNVNNNNYSEIFNKNNIIYNISKQNK
jgi:hypothetical protein